MNPWNCGRTEFIVHPRIPDKSDAKFNPLDIGFGIPLLSLYASRLFFMSIATKSSNFFLRIADAKCPAGHAVRIKFHFEVEIFYFSDKLNDIWLNCRLPARNTNSLKFSLSIF